MKLSPHEIAYVGKVAGFTDVDLLTFVAVCLAESGGDTEIMGRSASGESIGNRDHGLAQLSGKWAGDLIAAAGGAWRDPYVNAGIARVIFKRQGWAAWHVYTSGAYKTFLPDAELGVARPWAPPAPPEPVGLLDRLAARLRG